MAKGSYSGSFNDGQTAASNPVAVALLSDGLSFHTGGALKHWNYADLTSVGAITRGEACQIGSRNEAGALLFVGDPHFADALLSHASHLGRRAERRRVLYPILAIGAFIAAVVGAVLYFDIAISQRVAMLLPDSVRHKIGSQVAASLTKGANACDNPEGQRAFDVMLNRLTTGTEATKDFDVTIAPIGILNAFAAPGEKIVISDKLVKFVKSPEELAGVIAHEMGHGLELHPEAGIVRALGMSAVLNLMMGGNAGQLGEMGALLLQLRYTRAGEREADDHAITILREAGIRPKPFSLFFARLEKRFKSKSGKTKDNKNSDKNEKAKPDSEIGVTTDERRRSESQTVDKVLELLSTHPPLPERAKRIAGLKPWPSRPILTDGEWQALRRICD